MNLKEEINFDIIKMSLSSLKNQEKSDLMSIKSIYNQIKYGCSRKKCYNIYCFNNSICKNSKKN